MSTGSRNWFGLVLTVLIFSAGCTKPIPPKISSPSTPQISFDSYLTSRVPIADGFDFPIGDHNAQGSYNDLKTGLPHQGWYVAVHFNESYSLGIHTGEDWNGNGGGNTDLGQDVYAIANGRVTFAQQCGQPWGNVITIEHRFYENLLNKTIVSLYAHLNEIKVEVGQDVKRGQVIGTIGQDPDRTFNAHLHFELRLDETLGPTYWPSSNGKSHEWIGEHYTEPTAFIAGHRSLPVPGIEKRLVLVDQKGYKARFYENGVLQDEYDVSFGQGQGQKQIEGDNKTPKGIYYVVQKHQGQFEGPYAAYYGGHWIKINYPNKYDAERGIADGIISQQQRDEITTAWEKRQLTLQATKLGGGIGFHGWNKEWLNDGPRHLSWGCVVMHLRDIGKFYDDVPVGTMVVIF